LYPLYETRTRLKKLNQDYKDVQWEEALDQPTSKIVETVLGATIKPPASDQDYIPLDASISYAPTGSVTIGERRREYQALRDFCSYKTPVNVQENYMELVVQFGYVILFGQIFPLAGLFSMFSNHLQIWSQINNLARMNRAKPEVADGIGNWLKCIEILGHINVVTNSILIFFTHKSYKNIFVVDHDHEVGDEDIINEFNISVVGLDLTKFLMTVVLIEHMIIGVKLVISFWYEA